MNRPNDNPLFFPTKRLFGSALTPASVFCKAALRRVAASAICRVFVLDRRRAGSCRGLLPLYQRFLHKRSYTCGPTALPKPAWEKDKPRLQVLPHRSFLTGLIRPASLYLQACTCKEAPAGRPRYRRRDEGVTSIDKPSIVAISGGITAKELVRTCRDAERRRCYPPAAGCRC
jgi:hypothetical protein